MGLALVFVLDPTERGFVAFVVSVGSFLSTVSFLSLHVGVTRAYSRGAEAAAISGLLLSAVIALILAAAAAVVYLAHWDTRSVSASALALAIANAAVLVPSLYCGRLLQGLGSAGLFRRQVLAGSCTYLVGFVVLLAAGHATGWAVALAWTCSSISQLLLGLLMIAPLLGARPSWRSLDVQTSLAAHVGSTGFQWMYRADAVVLGFAASAASLGVYALAVSVSELIWPFAEAVSLSLFSREATRLEDTSDLRTRVREAAFAYRRIALLLAAFIGLAALAIPQVLPAYARASLYIWILLPGVVMAGETRVMLSLSSAWGRRRLTAVAGTCAFVFSLSYVPAVVLGGALGAALTSAFVYGASWATFQYLLRKDIRTEDPAGSIAMSHG
jgi:O-antigen/teichoic acid export membrane protein